MSTKLLPLMVLIGLTSGCASSLKTFDSNSKPTVGVPVSAPALVKITTKTTFSVVPGHEAFAAYCVEEVDSEFTFLPLGERSYITFDAAQFGKSEFKIEFNDTGALKAVSLNSDAAAGVDAVGGIVSSVLPFLAAPKAAPQAGTATATDPAQKTKEMHCSKKGTEVVSVERVTVS